MGRPEEPLQRDGSPVREFAFWLRDLRNRSGLTYQQLARSANYAISTMQAAAAGRSLPTLRVTTAFVTACKGDDAEWRAYWTQVKRALDADSPCGTNVPVRPSWAHEGESQVSAAPAPVSARGDLALGADLSVRTEPEAGEPGADWYVESFYALLRMDTAEPEAVEHRIVVALQDGLNELDTAISVPRVPDDGNTLHTIEAELLYGGSLELREQPYEAHFRHVISLARPLRAGERHEYQLRLRVPAGQPMAPHYVYVPFRRSDYFQLRVRFDRQRPPPDIRRLHGVPPAIIYERGPDGTLLEPDPYGEVYADFHDLQIGRGYGVRWQQ